MSEERVIRVSAKTSVPQLKGSIIMSIEEDKDVVLRALGASAVNQMYKGIASARGTLASKGKDLYIKPGFDEVKDGEEFKTVMVAYIVVD